MLRAHGRLCMPEPNGQLSSVPQVHGGSRWHPLPPHDLTLATLPAHAIAQLPHNGKASGLRSLQACRHQDVRGLGAVAQPPEQARGGAAAQGGQPAVAGAASCLLPFGMKMTCLCWRHA